MYIYLYISSHNELTAYGQTSCQTYVTLPAPCVGIDEIEYEKFTRIVSGKFHFD
jgi:hypothetical protein